ncbi:MAG: hypothetical protein QNJ05_07880 [Woeseiaceae bacterium]|nr:hypothetical protein [Woeseiaceae bacterium]
MTKKLGLSLLTFFILSLTSAATAVFADDDDESCSDRPGYKRVEVSGNGVHDYSTQILHRQKFTESGKRERTTDSIDLWGDLEGRVLYQPRSIYDFSKGTLVNTGRQVFSGTVLGSRPVMLYDDDFRFEVTFATGEVRGEVYLTEHLAGPRMTCELTIYGVAEKDDPKPEFEYNGFCWVKKRR